MQKEILFEVQGSATKPYRVVFIKKSDTSLSADCSCPAGEKGQYCKHRLNILAGLTENIVSNNLEEVKVVQSWLSGSELDKAIQKMHELESEMERIKKKLSDAKKFVAKTMRD